MSVSVHKFLTFLLYDLRHPALKEIYTYIRTHDEEMVSSSSIQYSGVIINTIGNRTCEPVVTIVAVHSCVSAVRSPVNSVRGCFVTQSLNLLHKLVSMVYM